MATVSVLHSMSILDADGNIQAAPMYSTFDDGTATLSSILAAASAEVALLEAITDGQVISHDITLKLDLPGGLKSAPVTGSNVQENGHFSFVVLGTPYSFGIDVPAIAQAALTGKLINQANADVSDFIDSVQGTGGTFLNVEPVSSIGLGTVKSAKKTFRKHR